MKKLSLTLLLLAITISGYCQSINTIVSVDDVKRIESMLSADNMQGRKAFTAGNQKAAEFIGSEFKKIGLEYAQGLQSYSQNFIVVKPTLLSTSVSFNGNTADPKTVTTFTGLPNLKVTSESGFKKVFIKEGDNFAEVLDFIKLKENLLVFVDNKFARSFGRLPAFKEYLPKSEKSVVFILGNVDTSNFEIVVKHEIKEEKATNVVAVLPGKNKKEEFVIFSGHYDHIGIGKPVGSDSIFNGANDDASGITAIIQIAKYYKAANNNERTLIFSAFTAEEIGGFGSQFFSQQLNPAKVVAMFNIEMIGTESKWGKNSAYITGFEKTDMGSILQKNLEGTAFQFYPDPYPEQNLFYRSDNATLAQLGVPAHTISTSKMDSEPNYHKPSDEISTLDLSNMTQIIQSVVLSAKTIVSGKDTPTRVKKEH